MPRTSRSTFLERQGNLNKGNLKAKLAGIERRRANLELARADITQVLPTEHLRWAICQLLLTWVGVDPVTFEGNGKRYTAQNVREHLIEPLSAVWDDLRADLPTLPPLKQANWKPIYALSNALRQTFGITHKQVGSKRHKTAWYALDAESLERARAQLNTSKESL